MKQLFSVLVAMTLALTFAIGQNGVISATQEKASQDGPQITFQTETVDYGVIEQGSEPFRVFAFTNTGNAPLIISHAKGSCGCTVPTYPTDPIAPGESGEIKVRYDTNRVGKFTKRVTLTTNVGTEQKVLTITGEVKPKPEEPAGLPSNDSGLFNN
ncbi:MAG TPA: DUF1573 domain-containing protein [Saprospiraceae bacterium]|nr:DUF1573 domain-containing protein [Saprospiraceae bacterium]HMQ84603.1 DUF1573 domain-containing protein [Saprospiraceae bacterium]